MPDAPIRTPAPRPMDWGDAFAALPTEAPSASGWPRVAATLDARGRNRWPLWLATAAALGLVALVPLQRSLQEDRIDARSVAASSAPVGHPGAATLVEAPAQASTRDPSREGGNPAERARIASRPGASPSMGDHPATVVERPRLRGNAGRQPSRPLATASRQRGGTATATVQPRSRPPGDSRTADAAATSGAAAAGEPAARAPAINTAEATMTSGFSTSGSTAYGSIASGSATAELDRLYAESAQLEALVALARDDRMSTGTVAALGGELQAQVARIDAALVDPSLTPGQRLVMWRDRVQALRELAGFETTQRLLAARGEQYDGMLVSVD